MKLKSIIIGQSGGPTTVINASLQGIIEAALSNPNIEHIYGALNGIEGILNKNIIDFRNEDLDNIQLLKKQHNIFATLFCKIILNYFSFFSFTGFVQDM